MAGRGRISLTDQKLATATAHPTRVHIMSVLNGRSDTPSNIAAELGRTIRHVTYHLEVLAGLNCVELVSVSPAAGGRVCERHYTAIRRPIFDATTWDQLGDKEKHGIVVTLMRLMSEEVADAMQEGTFYDPDDNHLSRTPMAVDPEGWQEVIELLDRTSEELLAIEGRVSDRLSLSPDQETMPTKVMMIHFRSPTRE